MMIMSSLILGDSQPINGSGRNGCIRVLIEDLLVQLLCLSPLLFHGGHTRQSHQKLRGKIVLGKITFDSITLFPVLVQNQNAWGPDSFKAPESGGIFFDVNANGNKVLFDK